MYFCMRFGNYNPLYWEVKSPIDDWDGPGCCKGESGLCHDLLRLLPVITIGITFLMKTFWALSAITLREPFLLIFFCDSAATKFSLEIF